MKITSTKTLEDAAKIHCRFWESSVWDRAREIRDRIIDQLDPEWPHDSFWEQVDELTSDEEV